MEYAIKNIYTGKYCTIRAGWTKNIMKADLEDYKTVSNEIRDNPKFFKDCKPVPIKETYTREEVKE